MARLIVGINLENFRDPKSKTTKLYQQYLGELIFTSAYVSEFHQQLKAYDLKKACRGGIFYLDFFCFSKEVKRLTYIHNPSAFWFRELYETKHLPHTA
jgi:hypothetical protein